MDKELIFLVEEAAEGGYAARALGHSIFAEGDTWDELKAAVPDAVRCHFDEHQHPSSACTWSRTKCWRYEIAARSGGEDLAQLLRRFG
jgi:hypothetical protein